MKEVYYRHRHLQARNLAEMTDTGLAWQEAA